MPRANRGKRREVRAGLRMIDARRSSIAIFSTTDATAHGQEIIIDSGRFTPCLPPSRDSSALPGPYQLDCSSSHHPPPFSPSSAPPPLQTCPYTTLQWFSKYTRNSYTVLGF